MDRRLKARNSEAVSLGSFLGCSWSFFSSFSFKVSFDCSDDGGSWGFAASSRDVVAGALESEETQDGSDSLVCWLLLRQPNPESGFEFVLSAILISL